MPKVFDFSSPPFDRLRPMEVERVNQVVDVVFFRNGHKVIGAGTLPDHFYVLIKGLIEERAGDEVVTVHEGGDGFDSEILVHQSCRHDFVVREEAICYALPIEDFLELTANNPAFAAFFFKDISQKLEALGQRQASPHALGAMTTRVRQAPVNAPVFVSAAVPSHSENAHVEADGFVLRQNGVTLTHVWRGVVTGGLPAHLGQASPPIEVIFLSPDSVEFIPDEPEFELRLDIADSSVVKWRSLDQWSFELLGESLGTTTLTLNVFHVDHDDFVSPTLVAQTYGSLATDPVAGRDGLRLASPFPNPVRGDATIRFDLPRAEQAEVGVFDVTGRRVAELANGPRAAGSHSTVWNTSGIRPGLYLVRLRTPSGERTTRVTVSH